MILCLVCWIGLDLIFSLCLVFIGSTKSKHTEKWLDSMVLPLHLVSDWLTWIMVCVFVYSKLMLTVDSTDDNYMPKRVTVYGGEAENLKKYSDVTIDEYVFLLLWPDAVNQISQQHVWYLCGTDILPFHRNLIGEVCVLEDMTTHVPVIEIRIEECRGNSTWRP